MSAPWYRSGEWSELDERQLDGRLRRYKTPFEKAQCLRIKAQALLQNADPRFMAVVVRLLTLAIEVCGRENTYGELPSAYALLAKIFDEHGDLGEAERLYQRYLETSLTPGAGLGYADFLTRTTNNQDKLDHAARLLDDVEKHRNPQLIFNSSKYRYCTARARLYHKLGCIEKAKEYAKSALRYAQAGPLDSFKRKPMDTIAQEPNVIRELEEIAGDEGSLKRNDKSTSRR